MRIPLTITILAALLLCLWHGTSPVAAADSVFAGTFDSPRWVGAYYVGYERDLYPLAEVDFSSITHLMVGRERPLAGGTLSTDFDIDTTNGPLWAQSAVDAAHAAGRKAVLMVGGAGEISGWRSAAVPANLSTFVTQLLSNVDTFHFDGLDLDWEPIQVGDETNFIALAQALRNARPNLILTVPIGWIDTAWTDPNLPAPAFWSQIAPLFDRVDIMTYDMAGAWEGWQSWHNSALYGETSSTPSSVSSSVAYYLAAGVPAGELGIGSAFYGDCWRAVTGPHQNDGTLSDSDGTMSYANIMSGYYSNIAYQWDSTARVPYLSSSSPLGAKSCTFVTYENAASIAEKAAFARVQGLGGTIIWTIGQGHLASKPMGQRDPLLDAIRQGYLER